MKRPMHAPRTRAGVTWPGGTAPPPWKGRAADQAATQGKGRTLSEADPRRFFKPVQAKASAWGGWRPENRPHGRIGRILLRSLSQCTISECIKRACMLARIRPRERRRFAV